MSKHFEDGQYDDDLTIGVDDFDTDDLFAEVDLLKYKPFESPLAKLKSLVLSIDWEITDDILREFNEELIALREMWADEKINLVYIQALQTISKYIYQEKSSAHPNAVKFLPAFYYNLEKIVLDENLTDIERHDILLADVKRFNNLKKQLVEKSTRATDTVKTEDVLQSLKGLVLSIDWEITESELDELRKEVLALERAYKASKPKLILLQGIGTLAAYIRHKGANAHADAFSLLHDFYGTLEKIATKKMSLEKEKQYLFVEVEKFNAFKIIISSTISPEALSRDKVENVTISDELPADTANFQPAFADVEDDSVSGFQEEQVAASLYADDDITNRLDSFFSDEPEEPEVEAITPDSPALGDIVEELGDVESEAELRLDDFFKDDFLAEESLQLDKELLLQGVDVETEADDDSEEEALPVFGDEIAPALSDNDEVSSFSEKALGSIADEQDDLQLATSILDDQPAKDVEAEDDFSLSFIDESSDFGEALTDIDLDSSVDDEDIEITSQFNESDDASPLPALADFDQEVAVDGNDEPEFEDQLGIESTLDAFFDDFDDTESEDGSEVVSEVAGTGLAPTPSQQVNLLKEYFDEDTEAVEGEDEIVASALVADEDVEESVDQFFGFGDDEDDVVARLSDSNEPEESVVDFVDDDVTEDTDLEEVDAFFDSPVSETVATLTESVADAPDLIENEIALPASEIELPEASVFVAEVDDTEVEESIDQFFGFDDDAVVAQTSDSDVPEDSFLDFVNDDTDDTDLKEVDAFFDSPVSETIAASAQTVAGEPELIENEIILPDTGCELSEDSVVADQVVEAEVEESIDFLFGLEDDDETMSELTSKEEFGLIGSDSVDTVVTDLLDDQEAFVAFVAVDESVPEDTVKASALSVDAVVADVPEDVSIPSTEEPVELVDYFINLRSSIQSLGIEIETEIVNGVFRDINQLRQRAVTTSLEKLFLQLLSTVVQHIDRNRYMSSDMAYDLVLSVFAGLESSRYVSAEEGGELLLAETYKVLQWQQDLIYVAQEEASNSSEAGNNDLDPEGESTDSTVIIEKALFSEGEDELIYAGLEEELAEESGKGLSAAGVDDIRSELHSLRETLQDEISQLRAEILGKK